MDVRDIEQEERITKEAVANGDSAERFDERLTPTPNEGDELLALFLQPDDAPDEAAPPAIPSDPMTLFRSDLHYCEAALHRLRTERDRTLQGEIPYAGARLRFQVDAETETLTLDVPEDLATRYGYLPPEVMPESRRLTLTTSRTRMATAIAESRRAEATWPNMHFLWRLSPVVEWLNDRMLGTFGRFEAPILAGVPGLEPNERIFVLSGLVPNRKGHPLIYEWIALSFRNAVFTATLSFDDLIDRTDLGRRPIPNRETPADADQLAVLLPEAVRQAKAHFTARRDAFEDAVNAKLNEEVTALDAFKERRLRQVDAELAASGQPDRFKRQRSEQVAAEIKEVHDEYLTWIEDTMTTERAPWVKVICVMTPGATGQCCPSD